MITQAQKLLRQFAEDAQQHLSYGDMQAVVYQYVLSKIKTDRATKEHIEVLSQNDTFWTGSFDDLLSAVEKSDYEDIVDSLAQAIDAVQDSIKGYYADSANFEPGYKKPQMDFTALEYQNVPSKDLSKLVSKIHPKLVQQRDAETKAQNVDIKKRRAAAVAAITPKRLKDLTAFVKGHDTEGWSEFFSALSTTKRPEDYFPPSLQDAEVISNITSAAELKDLFMSVSDTEYVSTILDNLSNLPEIERSEDADVQSYLLMLRVIAHNKALAAKLAPMLKA